MRLKIENAIRVLKCEIPILIGYKKSKIAALIIALLLLFGGCISSLTSCTQAVIVSTNVSKEADNFNVIRKITVINSRTDTIIYELEGVFSLANNTSKELVVICKTGENEYKKHYIYLTSTVLYVVEDLSGADVSPYHYKVTFYPQMIGGVDLAIGD